MKTFKSFSEFRKSGLFREGKVYKFYFKNLKEINNSKEMKKYFFQKNYSLEEIKDLKLTIFIQGFDYDSKDESTTRVKYDKPVFAVFCQKNKSYFDNKKTLYRFLYNGKTWYMDDQDLKDVGFFYFLNIQEF